MENSRLLKVTTQIQDMSPVWRAVVYGALVGFSITLTVQIVLWLSVFTRETALEPALGPLLGMFAFLTYLPLLYTSNMLGFGENWMDASLRGSILVFVFGSIVNASLLAALMAVFSQLALFVRKHTDNSKKD